MFTKVPLALFVLLILLTLTTGHAPWEAVFEQAYQRVFFDGQGWNPLLDERLPRLIILLSTGASLAVSGYVLQSLFQNPLASPSILGISCGGSLAAIFSFIFGFHLTHPYIVSLAAFGGSLFTLVLIYGLSKTKGGVHPTTLILSGVAISSLFLALQNILLYQMREQWDLMQTIAEWQSGSTALFTWKHVHMQLPVCLVGFFGCWHYRKEIDLLALGDEEAEHMGVDIATVRFRLFLCVALLTGGALATVGVIAFFGLVLPNLLRRISSPLATVLLPRSIIFGGLLFAWLDLSLRLFNIEALSLGNVSAVLGGIFFGGLLYESERSFH